MLEAEKVGLPAGPEAAWQAAGRPTGPARPGCRLLDSFKAKLEIEEQSLAKLLP